MNRAGMILVVSTACLTGNLTSCDRCCEINSRQLPYYKLIRSNARSNQMILSRTTVANVNECKEFALAKKALAFNYGLETDRREWDFDTGRKKSNRASRIMCQALECPEIHNFTTFVRDKNYKYYSMYPSTVSIDANFTLACIPRTGVFVFSGNNLSYSQAQMSCQKMNASLAHVISEERTNGLARYISEDSPTFVGLSNRDHENIWKNEFDRRRMNSTQIQFSDEPLSCFTYRAWAEGEPSHSKGCVALVQPFKSESGPFWRVVPCDSTLNFICEVSPTYRLLHNQKHSSL